MKLSQFSVLFSLLAVFAARAENVSVTDRYLRAMISGLAEESELPKVPGKLEKARILMLARVNTLLNAPYMGFLHYYQVKPADDLGDSIGLRKMVEERLAKWGGYSSILPKFAYYSETGTLDLSYSTSTYGNLLFEFRNPVLTKATYTRGDSMDSRLKPEPLSVEIEKPGVHYIPSYPYDEAQIWGPLWLSDVERLYIPEREFAKYKTRILELSKNHGFGITLIQWSKDGHDIKVIREIRPAGMGTFPKTAPLKDILTHIRSKKAPLAAVKTLGEIALDLPQEMQEAILKKSPEAANSLKQTQITHRKILRLTIMDRESPLLGRIEALRQWAETGLGTDFAMVEPMRELMSNPRVADELHSLKSQFEAPKTPALREASPEELILRHQMGYSLHPDEIPRLKKVFLKTPSIELGKVLARYSSLSLYEDQVLARAAKHPDLHQLLMSWLVTNPATTKELERVMNLIQRNPNTDLMGRLSVVLMHRYPSKKRNANLLKQIKSWILKERKNGRFPMVTYDFPESLRLGLLGYGPKISDEVSLALHESYRNFLVLLGTDLERSAAEIAEQDQFISSLKRGLAASACLVENLKTHR